MENQLDLAHPKALENRQGKLGKGEISFICYQTLNIGLSSGL
jgi:hypothetical protein